VQSVCNTQSDKKYYLKEHTKQRAFIVMPQVFIIKRARNGAASEPLEVF